MSATYDQLVTCDQCVAAMLDDPTLADDLLLIGLHWARAVHLGTPPLDGIGKSTARAVYGTGGARRVWDIIRTDIRRYVPDTSMAARCQRPIRRNQAQIKEHGETCGHPTCGEAHRALFVDPADGTRHSIGCCSTPRCVAWWNGLRARNQAELAAHCPPEPAANHGGILAKHLPELDWERIYSVLDPTWVPPREAEPWRPPTLTVVVDLDHEDSADVPRPVLSVVRGGWR